MPYRRHTGTCDTLTSAQISGKQAIGNDIQAASNRGLLPEAGRTPPGRMPRTLDLNAYLSTQDTLDGLGSGLEVLTTSDGRGPRRQGRSVRQNQADAEASPGARSLKRPCLPAHSQDTGRKLPGL
jgi:hypothetical protein